MNEASGNPISNGLSLSQMLSFVWSGQAKCIRRPVAAQFLKKCVSLTVLWVYDRAPITFGASETHCMHCKLPAEWTLRQAGSLISAHRCSFEMVFFNLRAGVSGRTFGKRVNSNIILTSLLLLFCNFFLLFLLFDVLLIACFFFVVLFACYCNLCFI